MDEDYDYYRQEEWLESLYRDFAADVLAGRDDLYGEVVNRFTTERLHSYYLANPGVIERAVWALSKAKLLLPTEPEASLVLAVTAAEVYKELRDRVDGHVSHAAGRPEAVPLNERRDDLDPLGHAQPVHSIIVHTNNTQ